ncbi:MAG: methyltransferase domain-containing protein [Desulfuromonas sp.]|nr:MAG: methyltransferase domain-containing protein [Desulfuromonas sp.]
MNRASRNRLNLRHIRLFDSDSLFDRIARSVCRAGCLPRKELYEAWEVARRVRRRFRGGRVVEMACGHGLLAHIMLLLDATSPEALAVDLRLPPSATALAAELQEDWPRLQGRVTFEEKEVEQIKLTQEDVIVSAHACGALSDTILTQAVNAGTKVAILPCCHNLDVNDTGSLLGWMDGSLAIDATRVARLRQAGYRVCTQTIPGDITPKNRLLLAEPE